MTDKTETEIVDEIINEIIAEEKAAEDMLAALEDITNHFADVMGGPLIAGRGIEFENGVEGIPTIARARVALAQAKAAGIKVEG